MFSSLFADRQFMFAGSAFYSLAFFFALLSLFRSNNYLRITYMILLYGGFVFQSVGLYLRGIHIQAFPLQNPFEIVQSLAWSAVALNLVLRPVFQLRLLHFFTAGFVATLGVISFIIYSWDQHPAEIVAEGSPWVGFHAALAIFSYGVFGVLAITSMMYLIQNYGLERMRSGKLFALLPAIRQLEDINGKLILLGVSVLSVAVVIGFLNLLAEPATIGFVKLTIACTVWGAYLFILYRRKQNKLVASPFAQSCIALFILALVSLWPLTYKKNPASESDPEVIEQHGTE